MTNETRGARPTPPPLPASARRKGGAAPVGGSNGFERLLFRVFCTFFTVLAVWAFGVQAPVSTLLYGCAIAADLYRTLASRGELGRPDRWPSVRLAHRMTIGLAVLLLAAGGAEYALPDAMCLSGFVDGASVFFHSVARQVAVGGGACDLPFGQAVFAAYVVFPLWLVAVAIWLSVAFVVDRDGAFAEWTWSLFVETKRVNAASVPVLVAVTIFSTIYHRIAVIPSFVNTFGGAALHEAGFIFLFLFFYVLLWQASSIIYLLYHRAPGGPT